MKGKLLILLFAITFSFSANGQNLFPYQSIGGGIGELSFNFILTTKDSSYKLRSEWETAPNGYYWYLDSGKFTFDGGKIKLYSSKPKRQKEDFYFVNDELTVNWVCEDTVWGFKAKTTKNIKYEKKKRVFFGEQPPTAWNKFNARLHGQYKRLYGGKNKNGC